MSRWRSLWGAAVMATGLALPTCCAVAGEPASVVGPDDPGPQLPPAGRSLFDELFATPGGYDIPYPFERLLEAVNRRIAPATARTALIPLGRSLQRYAAHPDYFQSPRLVVAVSHEGGGPGDPLLKDRLYLGYQPAAEAIEVISYNETIGRFEFQEVLDYGAWPAADVRYAARDVCVNCHQGHAPIFSRPLWSESNGDPKIAALLSELGERYHGAPVRQGIDALDDFDQSTDRANRLSVVKVLWDQGCGQERDGAACRAALLAEALRYRLSGARAEWRSAALPSLAERLQGRLAELWPDGLGGPSPDLVNREPLIALAAVDSMDKILETDGPLDPETRRPVALQWSAAGDAAATFDALARDVGGMFTAGDIGWLDARLARFGANPVTYRASCREDRVARGEDRVELRLDCGEKAGELKLAGFVILQGSTVTDARIDALSIGDGDTLYRLEMADGTVMLEGGSEIIRLSLREAGAGLTARLLSGRRIVAIEVRSYGRQAIVRLDTEEDLPALDTALGALASSEVLGSGPLRRRAVLRSLARLLADE